MLALTPQMRILAAVEAVDFRKGIDSLAELCRAKLDADPFSGCLFVFRSRRATAIKVLVLRWAGILVGDHHFLLAFRNWFWDTAAMTVYRGRSITSEEIVFIR